MRSFPISVTILTKDSSFYLKRVLEALKNFDEVLIYDTGSKDNTLEIVKNYPNTTLYKGLLDGFGKTHNIASNLAKNDWILSIDSDEVVSSELLKEIESLNLDPKCVYCFPRKNFFQGKWIRGCGWFPDRQKKLYNRKVTCFSNAKVHETVLSNNLQVIHLNGPLLHYSYKNTEDFLRKMQSYSTLFAEQNGGKKSSSVFKAINHGVFGFFKSYILKKGFLSGYEGFVISINIGITAFYKYIKLYEKNKKLSSRLKYSPNAKWGK